MKCHPFLSFTKLPRPTWESVVSHSWAHSAFLWWLFLLHWSLCWGSISTHMLVNSGICTHLQSLWGRVLFPSLPLIISVTHGSAGWSCSCVVMWSYSWPRIYSLLPVLLQKGSTYWRFPGHAVDHWMLQWGVLLPLAPHWEPNLGYGLSLEHWAHIVKARQPTGYSLWISFIISPSLSLPTTMGPPKEKKVLGENTRKEQGRHWRTL